MEEENQKKNDYQKYISKYEEMQESTGGEADPEELRAASLGEEQESPPVSGNEEDSRAENDKTEVKEGKQENAEVPDRGDRPVVEKVEFAPFTHTESRQGFLDVETFSDIPLSVSAELGKTQLKVRDLIGLEKGSLLKLNRLADESISILVNEIPFAQGEVVVINERFGVRVVSFLGEQEESER